MTTSNAKSSAQEFLPAVLEVQETPPMPVARYIGWAIVLFFIIAVVWACIGHVNVVAVAHGKLVPSSRVKTIQPLESGVVRTIHVSEGDRVETGQLLIELDSTSTGADRSSLQDRIMALEAERSRLLTLLENLKSEEGAATQALNAATKLQWVDWPVGVTAEQNALQRQRLRAQLYQYRSQLAALAKDEEQKRAELAAIDKRIAKLDATIPLISEQSSSLQKLLKKSMAPRMQWLEAEEERVEQIRERDIQVSNRQNVIAAIAATRERQQAFRAEFEQQRLNELYDTENQLQSLRQELIKAEKRLTLQQLRAPVSGTVDQLAINTISGVVTPAQELMTIVPNEDPLEVEAWIENKDIGFIKVGQPAEVKVNTFQFTKYGAIPGQVVNISTDAVEDEKRGLIYEARIRPEKTSMNIDGREVQLSSGMAISAEVNIGKRRLIEYILTPLLRYKEESLNER